VQKTLSAALVFVAVASAIPACGATSGQMHVSVEVIARTILTIDSQPSSVQVTAADVSRGYIDLPQAIVFHVRSNARDGYSLQFQPVSGPFTTAVLSWSNAIATVGADASWMAQPYQRGITTGSMSVRLTLAPGTTAGTYAWPVALGADSL
jgi:hypothetical protein